MREQVSAKTAKTIWARGKRGTSKYGWEFRCWKGLRARPYLIKTNPKWKVHESFLRLCIDHWKHTNSSVGRRRRYTDTWLIYRCEWGESAAEHQASGLLRAPMRYRFGFIKFHNRGYRSPPGSRLSSRWRNNFPRKNRSYDHKTIIISNKLWARKMFMELLGTRTRRKHARH